MGRGAMPVLLSLGAAVLIAACGASKAEEAAKAAKARYSEGQVCAAASLEPAETTYKAACEAKQRKEASEREQTERRETAERKANERREAAYRKAEEETTKHEEEATKREEKKQAAEGSSEHPPPSSAQTVPRDLVGKALPAAERELESEGIQFRAQTINGDVVILKSDWGVCSTTPSGGASVTGTIVLHLGHFQCGA